MEKAEGMKPGDERCYFSLYVEYIALAKAEDDESDFLNADHFASKAITIGDGRPLGRFGGEPQTAHRNRGCSEGSREADQ